MDRGRRVHRRTHRLGNGSLQLPMNVAIVIPCFNEQLSLRAVRQGAEGYDLWFVDDGSTDWTWPILDMWQRSSDSIHAIRLPRNRGHQRALLIGLLAVKGRCDCAITMDADGQHPLSAIPEMLERYRQGADIVLGVRRHNPSALSRLFYRLFGGALVPNHGDFRLLSARVLETLTEDSQPFLRGLFANTGFKTAIVEYDERPRVAGRPNYTLRKRIELAWMALKWRWRWQETRNG